MSNNNEWSVEVVLRCLMVVGIGVGTTQQLATNTRLAQALGSGLFSALVSFAIGMVALLLLLAGLELQARWARTKETRGKQVEEDDGEGGQKKGGESEQPQLKGHALAGHSGLPLDRRRREGEDEGKEEVVAWASLETVEARRERAEAHVERRVTMQYPHAHASLPREGGERRRERGDGKSESGHEDEGAWVAAPTRSPEHPPSSLPSPSFSSAPAALGTGPDAATVPPPPSPSPATSTDAHTPTLHHQHRHTAHNQLQHKQHNQQQQQQEQEQQQRQQQQQPSSLIQAAAPPRPRVPLWAVLGGGMLGALYVSGIIFASLRIGLAICFAVSVAGQLGAASAVDHVGFLGTPRRAFTRLRAAALLVAIAGCVMSVAERVRGGDVGEAVGFSLVALVCGAILPVQTCINRRLAVTAFRSNMLRGSLVSFVVGVACLGLASLLLSLLLVYRYGQPAWGVADSAAWMYTGGLFGALFVYGTLLNAPAVGMARMYQCLVLGQLASSLLYDNYAVLGVAQNSATPLRIVGVFLVLVGAVGGTIPLASAVRRISVAVGSLRVRHLRTSVFISPIALSLSSPPRPPALPADAVHEQQL